MTVKEIFNEAEGNDIERIIFNRFRRHIFMLYPYADVQMRLISIVDEPGYNNGEYFFIVSEYINFLMDIHPYHIQKMICMEFYNPFFEDDLRTCLKNFMESTTKLKSLPVENAAQRKKPCMRVYFRDKKKNVLKRIWEGLGL